MAIASANTTISAASAIAAATAFQTAIRDALVAHPSGAWTLVEEFDSASSTVHWWVIKNTAATSGEVRDFYLCFGRTAATGAMSLFVCEAYNSTTHTASLFAAYTSGNPVLASDGTITASSFVLATTFPNNSTNLTPWSSPLVVPTASSFKYQYAIDAGYIVFATSYSTNPAIYYFGYGDSTVTGITDPGLLMGGGTTFSQSASLANTGSLYAARVAASGLPRSDIASIVHAVTLPSMVMVENPKFWHQYYGGPDVAQNNLVIASRLFVVMYANYYTGNTPAGVGNLRGLFRNVRVATFPRAAVFGDTIVVDGRKFFINAPQTIGNTVAPVSGRDNANFSLGLVIDSGAA